MVMSLHEPIDLNTIDLDTFDFLVGVRSMVRRMDEVNGTDDSDCEFVYLCWLNNSGDEGKFIETVEENGSVVHYHNRVYTTECFLLVKGLVAVKVSEKIKTLEDDLKEGEGLYLGNGVWEFSANKYKVKIKY